jgi:hypothetical protein
MRRWPMLWSSWRHGGLRELVEVIRKFRRHGYEERDRGLEDVSVYNRVCSDMSMR